MQVPQPASEDARAWVVWGQPRARKGNDDHFHGVNLSMKERMIWQLLPAADGLIAIEDILRIREHDIPALAQERECGKIGEAQFKIELLPCWGLSLGICFLRPFHTSLCGWHSD